MNIDRNNYEEYFILYLDNELTPTERKAVEAFAAHNADLQDELNLLMQSKLIPDESFTFTDKSSLFKSADSSINARNYEEWMLSSIDDELTVGQQKELDQYLADHPQSQHQLELLMKVKLQPEPVYFLHKNLLYRQEEVKTKLVSFQWKRYAAAAAILLFVGSAALFVSQLNNKAVDAPVAVADKPLKKLPSTDVVSPVNHKIETPVLPVTKESITSANVKVKVKLRNEVVVPTTNSTIDEHAIAVVDVPSNNKIESLEANSLTNTNADLIAANVTSAKGSAFIPTEGDDGNDLLPAEPGKQKKLRGIFRKITRTFEKNTNIKATDDDDRLLLGGLAIRL